MIKKGAKGIRGEASDEDRHIRSSLSPPPPLQQSLLLLLLVLHCYRLLLLTREGEEKRRGRCHSGGAWRRKKIGSGIDLRIVGFKNFLKIFAV